MAIIITKKELRRNSRLRAAVDAEIARSRRSKPQRNRRTALVRNRPFAQGMVDIAGPLLIRITRFRNCAEADDDNFVGGCKQLRDAIASALSRKGDSEKDGLRWEYAQRRGDKTEVMIEVFADREVNK